MAGSIHRINAFLQSELGRRGLTEVAAVEAAFWLDEAGLLKDSHHRPGLPLRELLRNGEIDGSDQRPPKRNGRWFITLIGSDRRRSKVGSSKNRAKSRLATKRISPAIRKVSASAAERSEERPSTPTGIGHRVVIEWMGEDCETLDDLLGPTLRVICIGINPAPTSVERGHYYQGASGQRFLGRLRYANLLPASPDGWEDDDAFRRGIGFTDVVKRPTSKGDAIPAQEFVYGKQRLEARLAEVRTELAIFSFKAAAVAYFGQFNGHGFVPGLTIGGGEVFVMPGPYEATEIARVALDELKAKVHRPGWAL